MDNFSHYRCSSEWHFATLKGKGAHHAALIYSFALHLAGEPGIFWASISKLAEHFKLDERTVRKALRLLVEIGFFQVVYKPHGDSVRYRVVRHKAWAAKHPGHCVEKYTTTYEGQHGEDELAIELYQLSGGRFIVAGANLMKGIRNTGHSEAAIKQHFQDFIKEANPKGREWKFGLVGKFIKYLRAVENVTV